MHFLMGLTMLNKLTTLKLSSLFAALMFSMSVAQAAGPVEVFKPDLAKGKEIMQQCVACHGADGNASAPIYPKIAGQHAEYLYKQLVNFKPGKDGEKPLRDNAIMAGFAAALSDEDMKNVSAYLQAQKQIGLTQFAGTFKYFTFQLFLMTLLLLGCLLTVNSHRYMLRYKAQNIQLGL